jgi:circadian clock protein KaiB
MGRAADESRSPGKLKKQAAEATLSEQEFFALTSSPAPYLLRLYVAGNNLKSTSAIQIMRNVCASMPKGRCELEVVDLYQQPELAKQDNIVAAPSVVKVHPPPRRTFIGLLNDEARILQKLGIPVLENARTGKRK